MTRIVIAGGPGCGKTTFAFSYTSGQLRHTDDVMRLGWSEASAEVATWFDEPGPWIVEGVAVARALRKWLLAHPTGKPCDEAHWLNTPRIRHSPGQATMAKGAATVWREIVRKLRARGVKIVDHDS